MTTVELLRLLRATADELTPDLGGAVWYLFGSALRDARSAADYDVAIVCSRETAIVLRRALKPLCLRLPVHLMILTPSEDQDLNFTGRRGAVQFFP